MLLFCTIESTLIGLIYDRYIGRRCINWFNYICFLKLQHFRLLNNLSEGLLYDAFVCNKELNSCQTNTWYSSILLILNKMNISNVNDPPPRGCAGGRIGTRFLHPRGTSPLKGVNPRV